MKNDKEAAKQTELNKQMNASPAHSLRWSVESAFEAGYKAGATRLEDLVKRFREWDHLDNAADGQFWKDEIDKITTRLREEKENG